LRNGGNEQYPHFRIHQAPFTTPPPTQVTTSPTSLGGRRRALGRGETLTAVQLEGIMLMSIGSAKLSVSRLRRCVAPNVVAGGMMQRNSPSHRPIPTTVAFRCSAMSTSIQHCLGGLAPYYHSTSNCNYYSSTTSVKTERRPTTTKRIPRKAALAVPPKAREVFKQMIAATGSQGII
jgi:hypothetical protein